MTFDDFKTGFLSFDNYPFAKGGQKEVYGAIHPKFGDVVVKVLFKSDARSDREIELMRKYCFADVPVVYEVETIDYCGTSTKAIVEERVSGKDLRSIIKTGKRYDLYEATDFMQSILKTVNEVWAHKIVHRDIKPENIILKNDGHFALLDFGIARALDESSITATSEGSPFTPGYAAPEVFIQGKGAIDTRADLFSVGVVTYELVTGENPFRKHAQNVWQVLYNTTTVTPLHHSLDGDVQSQFMGLVSSMMSRDRFARPRDAAEALMWLNAAKATFA